VKRGDEATVKIEAAAIDGKSVARVKGLVVFVRGGVPGDEAKIRLLQTKKRYAEAEVIDIVAPSPERITPRCRYFGECGGCVWQHIDYAAQLVFKRRAVVDAIERIGGFSGITVNPPIGSDDVYYYRNKMEFSFGPRWRSREEMERPAGGDGSAPGATQSFALGLHPQGRFDKVLDLEECWLQSAMSARLVNAVRSAAHDLGLEAYDTDQRTGYLRNVVVREGKRTGEVMVNIVTKDDNPRSMTALKDRLLAECPGITTIVNNITARMSQVAVGETEKVYHGPGFITERIGSRTYRISANSFFQTNTLQAERLYETVRRMAGLTSADVVFDLYAGTGTIALHLAADVKRVVGVEAFEPAVRDAERNARENGVGNCTFILGDLRERLTKDRSWLEHNPAPDVVVVDPPRAGMHGKVTEQIRALGARRIVYVSCNPATQARDLGLLCTGGAYCIDEVQPVDMFPHTYHVESVACLSRVSAGQRQNPE